MTFIHGVLSLSNDYKQDSLIHAMLAATQDFTPDSMGHWQQGNIALGANLLQTLPKGRYEQTPVVVDSRLKLSIVADARIDNREELLQALSFDPLQPISDVRLILAAYQYWGEDCAAKLIGDFAFAIWNQVTQSLFCCRDVFAQRPFYYYHSDDVFIFSSDLAALLRLDIIPKALDEGYIIDQLSGLNQYKDHTPYQHIHCLNAAHWLSVAKDKYQTTLYWQPDLTQDIRFEQDEQYVVRYLKLLTEAVRCRLVSDSPIASFISGGLDASSISVMASRILNEQDQSLTCFCHVLPEIESSPEKDEKALVQQLADFAGLQVVWISREVFNEMLPVQEIGNVFSNVNPFLLASLNSASHRGCKVFIGGFGGDQLATQQAYHLVRWQVDTRDLSGFYRQAKALAITHKCTTLRAGFGLLRQFPPFQSSRRLDQKIAEHMLNRCAFNSNFAKRIDMVTLARSAYRYSRGNPSSFRESLWNAVNESAHSQSFGAATFSRSQLEARYPMFDRRLVEFCLAIPPEQHRLGAVGRRLIRRATQDILPDALRLRNNKRYSANPGIEKDILMSLQARLAIIDKAYDIPEIRQYVDLDKIKARFKALPEWVEQGQQKNFKLGATLRAFNLVKFLINHYSQR